MKTIILLVGLSVGLIFCKPGAGEPSMAILHKPLMLHISLNLSRKNLIKCSSKVIEAQIDTIPDKYVSVLSVMKGKWYQKVYIEDIGQTKSPAQSRKAGWLINLNMLASRLHGDTLNVRASSVNEGYRFQVFLGQPGLTKHSFRTDIITFKKGHHAEFGYKISEKDTVLAIIYYGKNGRLFNKVIFEKAPETRLLPTRYMVNKILFAGNYTILNQPNLQSFNGHILADGSIEGWPGFENYFVVINFATGSEHALDQIIFNQHQQNEKNYTYQIKGDTIKIYTIKRNADYEPYPGDLVYTLVKK